MTSQKRKTIKSPFAVEGKELHTGKHASIKVYPAKSGTGILFRHKKIEAEANIASIAMAHKSTTSIRVGNKIISSIEHVLAAAFGLGITDILIEIEYGSEMPIFDGSAMVWVDKINKAGIKELNEHRNHYKLLKPVSFVNDISEYVLIPSNKFTVNLEINFPKTIIGTQHASYKESDSFEKNISWARTFIGDAAHGKKLNREKILDRLKSVDIDKPEESPCILYEGMRYITPLRQGNEPAAHKLLDFIGDFSLIGAVVGARINVKRPTHKANHLLVKKLLNERFLA